MKKKGIKVDIQSVGGGADYGASLKVEFAKGTEAYNIRNCTRIY